MNNNLNTKNSNNESISNKEKDALTLLNFAKEKVPGFFEPERYKTLLNYFHLFHRYSHINIILIYSQFQQATYLAGFKTWQQLCVEIWNDPNRQVLKQEYKGNGIKLLAPYTHVQNRTERKLMNFVVSVFDISQTNNLPPLEQPSEFLLEPPAKQLLSAARHLSPYRFVLSGRENTILENGMLGYCDHNNQLIVLSESLKGSSLLAEALRATIEAEMTVKGFNLSEYNDLVVESVLYILNLHFGRSFNSETNNLLFTERYQMKPLNELNTALYAIQQVSHAIIERTELFLEEIQEYESEAWLNEEELLDFGLEAV